MSSLFRFKSDRYHRAKRVVDALIHGTGSTYNTGNIPEQLAAYRNDLTVLGIANMPVGVVRERAEAIIAEWEIGQSN